MSLWLFVNKQEFLWVYYFVSCQNSDPQILSVGVESEMWETWGENGGVITIFLYLVKEENAAQRKRVGRVFSPRTHKISPKKLELGLGSIVLS